MSRAPTFAEIGGRIRQAREDKGLSQGDLAKALGVTRPVVTKIEQGAKATNSVELRKIADLLGASMEELTASIQEDSLSARFRASVSDEAFLDSVEKVETVIRDMLAQIELRERPCRRA